MKRKLLIAFLALACVLTCAFALFACTGGGHTHNFGEWTVTKQATCTQEGERQRTCSCGEKQTEKISKLPHTEVVDEAIPATCTAVGKTEGKHCSVCNAILSEPHEVPALGHDYQNGKCTRCGDELIYTYSSDGKYIYFGSYPQSQVESSLSMTLTAEYAQSNMLPSSDDARGWTDYGYYNKGEVKSYMWYLDVEKSDAKYRAVYFTSYRASRLDRESPVNNANQSESGYSISTVYWFKFDKIEWRILQKDSSSAFLMSNLILDSQEYDVTSNNYALSAVRKWLNETFYSTAFSEKESALIQLTTVNNGLASTGDSSNQNTCENTQDKVFLLSVQDVTNAVYGFDSDYQGYDEARKLKSTDYAKAQGTDVYTRATSPNYGNGCWWLRTPYSGDSGQSRYVLSTGNAKDNINVFYTNEGIVPALKIKL